MSYDAVFANPAGRTSRGQYLMALIPFLVALALYTFVVKGRTGAWSQAALLFPAFVLHARRLHDMGKTAWLLVVPLALLISALWLRLNHGGPGLLTFVNGAALGISAVFVLWAALGSGQAESNRFGDAPA